jgi:hypothetical protein
MRMIYNIGGSVGGILYEWRWRLKFKVEMTTMKGSVPINTLF